MRHYLLLFFTLLASYSFAQQRAEYQEYLEKREALLRQDSLRYFDHAIKLSAKEMALNEQLLELQRQMLQDYKEQHFFPPARNFYGSKAHIEATPLFKLLRKMPKGGMLHIHTSAMGDADWYLKRAIELPEMHVYWADQADENWIKGQFRAFNRGEAPEGFVSVQEEHSKDPDFYPELRSLITFEQEMDRDSVDIWGEFQSIFRRITGLYTYRPVFEDYIFDGMRILAEDNIQHVDLRMSFQNGLYDLEMPPKEQDIEEFVHILESLKKRIQAIDPAFSFTLIHVNLRFRDRATIWRDMRQVYEYRKKYPNWLKGYDLVAEEDNGHSTLFHAETFLKLDSLEKAEGTALPIYLHDGESNWVSVDNLYDAMLLGTKRIGHGFNLFRFPTLMEQVRDRDICMEINPLSNQILGYIRDLRMHPASTYLRRGINCSISSDDPMIFDYHGLSYDYWSIFLAWELDLAALKKLSWNGIHYSALSEKEKAAALEVWEERWNQFVDEALIALKQ